MIDDVLAKVFGTKNEREIKKMRPTIAAISDLEPQIQPLSDAELAHKTVEFKERIAQGATLDDLLIEAFAVVREAGRRVVNMRHFDVQLIGGMVLHRGKIAEMKTGEGKTLVATLPVYLNALAGKGVHVITVNDYLAKRDSEWMGKIYRFLGLSVGVIVHDLDDEERQQNYGCDVTYGTNNEFGFDYLRDNMKFRLEDCVQRGHFYSIVDEVDSILIDEARTPLIISGASEESTDKYFKVNRIIPKLIRGEVIEGKEPGEKYYTGDYTIDERTRSVALTDEGFDKAARLLSLKSLWDLETIEWKHHVEQALKAHTLFHRDKDYVVKEDQVIIVDEFTGRMMPGRRWSDGLHQAIEAKESVKIERENQTLATITFQNYFRMYKKLAGMTGTAETEAAEFQKIYNLDVTVVPTNRTLIRKEFSDVVYRTEDEKFRNAAKEIKDLNQNGQPVLVGTISVEKSEKLASILKRMGVKHEVLNAKHHEREALIVAQAGRKGAVTVSTNMAGRGTDILLGGNPEYMTKEACLKEGIVEVVPPEQETFLSDEHFVFFHHQGQFYRTARPRWDELFSKFKGQCDVEHDEVTAAGGLHILGTERHESRRIDNQLRGRAGRQGDPGSSRFYLSLQDDLLRIFGGERIQNLMLRLGMEEDVPIESRLITKRIAAAQKAVEAQNFAARKHLLEYDDVMNKQRQAVYGWRHELLEGGDQKEKILDMTRAIVGSLMEVRCPEKAHVSTYDLAGLQTDILSQFGVKINTRELSQMSRRDIEETIYEQLEKTYNEKEELVSAEILRETERMIMLHVIDDQWKDHLLSMDHLKEGIGLRGYGQKDPLVEYKKESFELFQEMWDRIEDESVRYLFFLKPVEGERPVMPFPEEEDEDDEEDDEGRETRRGSQPRGSADGANLPPGFHAQHPAEEGKGNGRTAVYRRRFDFDQGADRQREKSRPQRSVSLRQRKEIQEMLRRFIVIALGSWLLAFGQEPDKAIWDEYGLQDVQQIGHATAYRLKDPTGAFAAFQWQRPENAHPSKMAALAAETPDQLLVAQGNYLLRFDAAKPSAGELKTLVENLPRLEQGTLPVLSGYLPAPGLVPNSEKYVLGPESLAKFAPQITPSVAGFHLGAEAQVARFRSKTGVLNLAVFSYPTPQIARQRVRGFEALPGLMVKRSGPLIAVVPSPGNADDAERLLSRVNYQATITWDQYVPSKRDNIGVLVINCFILIGILIGFGAVGGLALGGLRAMYRRWLGLPETPDPIITLGLQNK